MIRVALNHKSTYRYSNFAELGPQVVRLRPAPHCRTPITAFAMKVTPDQHFINWQQDPHSNYLARLVFAKPTELFEVEVDLVAEMTVINPFDFFLESTVEQYPFSYSPVFEKDLKPYLTPAKAGPKLFSFLASIEQSQSKTIDFLVALNQHVQNEIQYVIRLEPGVQSPEETLSLGRGSCRDSAWLLVQILRHLGLAARFVSGYLIQLKPDVESLDGPSGAAEDFTDLHAWTEVYLPGAGWVGLDPTSGLLAGEGHVPLACTPEPITAAPITGTVSDCEVNFRHEMTITRIHEDPRVTKPYTEEVWQEIESLGHAVDERLRSSDVRLTMGGEPTFVSIDDMQGDEWKTDAVGPTKRGIAAGLLDRLRRRFALHGFTHYGQGKWYPGESLPRWSFTCFWRTDGQPLWNDPDLLANPDQSSQYTVDDAKRFSAALAFRLNVDPSHAVLAYEDALYDLWKEQRLPVNADLRDRQLLRDEDRARLARHLERGLTAPVGCVLPVQRMSGQDRAHWTSGLWPLRSDHMFLIPGDSPMGLRLPLDSLPVRAADELTQTYVPFEETSPLPAYEEMRQQFSVRNDAAYASVTRQRQVLQGVGFGGATKDSDDLFEAQLEPKFNPELGHTDTGVIRTAICFEPRDGKLHIFMPPVDDLDAYLELITAIEVTAEELNLPVVIEGYLPPEDYRLQRITVTPDPGVIEVNVHPAGSWDELVGITSGVYEDARQSRLGTEKFDQDGTHTGTGGGNHVVMGGRTPADSPFLRRPELLGSLLRYWHNHPSLSYLFSGRFIGPTSQAPRVDEGRRDAMYELQIALDQTPKGQAFPPWLVDRLFRHLLVDLTGNTHRAEFSIDKLYSPDGPHGRLGLVEFRAFEMPPHWQMSLTQQLLMRSLVSRFWEQPYKTDLIDWYTSIHDHWMLPHFVQRDFEDVIEETNDALIPLNLDWFAPHFEFRFPVIGSLNHRGLHLELRAAIEPWYVLGEESTGAGTSRYVDSSVERMQVKVQGNFDHRHIITCNGRKVPLHPTGTQGEFVAGIRYRAWQPPSCLHPTITSDDPLVFDVVDTHNQRSVAGCRYHVGHPGGLNPESFPVNAYEAESRRAGRFVDFGHTGGKIDVPQGEPNAQFPMTLDLRRSRPSV